MVLYFSWVSLFVQIIIAAVINRTGKEINRRKDMLKNLSSKADQMAIALNMSSLANRQNLLGPDKKMDDIMSRTADLDNHGLVSFQRQIMKGM